MQLNLKKILSITVLFLVVSTSITAQQNTASQSTPVQETVKLTSSSDSSQYILGAYLGQYLIANGLTITNANLFIKGMDDVLKNRCARK